MSSRPPTLGHTPLEITANRAARTLTVAFDDGENFTLSAELLRVHSPSAEVQGHAIGDKKTVPGKRLVSFVAIEPVGNYAIRIIFDDGHDSGLFSWDTLYTLGRNADSLWATYVQELAEKGLGRDL